jgi:hypothetical protein
MKRVLLGLTAFLLMSAPALAQSNLDPERIIMSCRTSAETVEQQVTCLEDSLRTALPMVEQPDWANGGSIVDRSDNTGRSSDGVIVSNSAQPSGIGAEQVQVEQDIEHGDNRLLQREESIVADFAYNQNDKLIIVLSNGQVWKQRTGDSVDVFLKKGDAPKVIVRKGAVSGYRMNFPDLNQTIIVSRIQ